MASPTSLDLLAPVHRLSVEEYVRMAETGLYDGGPRVELIDGVVVEMSPIGDAHLRGVMWLNRNLVPQLADDHILSPQQATALPALRSMPEPDIAILDVAEVLRRTAQHPRLLIEVSDSSLRFDRITKSRLYARGGVPEYWIVNIGEQTVEVHRQPTGDTWASRTVERAGAVLRPVALPGVEVDLADLFVFIAANA